MRQPILNVSTVSLSRESKDESLLKLGAVLRRAKHTELSYIEDAVSTIMLGMGYERAPDDVEEDWVICLSDSKWHLNRLYRRPGMTNDLYIGFGFDGFQVMPLVADFFYKPLTLDDVAGLKWRQVRDGKTWVADDYGRYYISDENPTSWLAKVVKAMKSRGKTISRKVETMNKTNKTFSVRSIYLTTLKHPEEIAGLSSVINLVKRDDSKTDDLRDAVLTLMRGLGYLEATDERLKQKDWDYVWGDKLNLLCSDEDGNYVGIVDDDQVRSYLVEFGADSLEPQDVAKLKWSRARDGKTWVARVWAGQWVISEENPAKWLDNVKYGEKEKSEDEENN